jgi:hypothetical protein
MLTVVTIGTLALLSALIGYMARRGMGYQSRSLVVDLVLNILVGALLLLLFSFRRCV